MGSQTHKQALLYKTLLYVTAAIVCVCTVTAWLRPHYQAMAKQRLSGSVCPPPPCIDALVLYHPDDEQMMVRNGGLQSALDHLLGVRRIFVLSASRQSFSHLPVTWIDEKRAPFSASDFNGTKRPPGWLYQQALKLWAVLHVEELCNDVIVLDSDILWLRDFDVRSPVEPPRGGWPAGTCQPPPRLKYNLASQDRGGWYGDIHNKEYHHFVNWLLGMPKVFISTHTAINNFQVMQRDVLARLEAGLKQRRGFNSIHEALIAYANLRAFKGMSEYEAYFSLAWYHYRERIEPVYLPWVLQKPALCDYNNKTMVQHWRDNSIVVYMTCHDNYNDEPCWINCQGRRPEECDPDLPRSVTSSSVRRRLT